MKKAKSFTTKYRFIATFVIAAIVTTLFVSYGFGTQAAEPRDAIFDPTFYAATYPDVAAVYGNDPVGLWKHFTICGMFEGRQGNAEFNVHYYMNAYPDLRAAFGDNLPAYYNHYMTCGKAEGRIGNGTVIATQVPTQQATAQTTTAQTSTASSGQRVLTPPSSSGWKSGEEQFYRDILNSAGVTASMSDMEVARAIHDYLCRTFHYAQNGEPALNSIASWYSTRQALNDPSLSYMHDSLREELNRTGMVCTGYANSFGRLMNICGIQTEAVSGTATNSAGVTGAHGWNRSLINGQWLYTDVTWDDNLGGSTRYFMISASEMNRNHYPR